MARHNRSKGRAPNSSNKGSTTDSPEMGTLKELLSKEMIGQLQEKADDLKAQEERQKQEKRRQAEEARKAERKKLENDFEYLLNNSELDWKKFK